MTQTIQPRSCDTFCKTIKALTAREQETEDNRSLLLSIYDSLNNLYEMLNKLNYTLERKNIEQLLFPEDKGETK